MSNSIIKDIKDLMQFIMIKQKKYKYKMIQETSINPKCKTLRTGTKIIKYHKEKIWNEELGKNKMVEVMDKAVFGSLASLLLYMRDECVSFGLLPGSDTG